MVLLAAFMMVAGLSLCLGGGCGNNDIPRIFIMLGRIVKVVILAGLITTIVLVVWAYRVRPPKPPPAERSLGRWAIWSALTTLLLLVAFPLLDSKGHCPAIYGVRCTSVTPVYLIVSWVDYAGFLAGFITMIVLTIRAWTRHRARPRQSPSPQPILEKLPYGRWALGSALLTLLLLVGSVTLFTQAFCLFKCEDNQRSAGQLFDVSWVGFLVGVVVTTVLAVRAPTPHRQDNRALLALVAVVVPFVVLGGVFTVSFW